MPRCPLALGLALSMALALAGCRGVAQQLRRPKTTGYWEYLGRVTLDPRHAAWARVRVSSSHRFRKLGFRIQRHDAQIDEILVHVKGEDEPRTLEPPLLVSYGGGFKRKLEVDGLLLRSVDVRGWTRGRGHGLAVVEVYGLPAKETPSEDSDDLAETNER